MNPLLVYALKLTALAIQAKTSGLTDELRAAMAALTAEANDSILEPQDSGDPWDEAAILRWYDEHQRIAAEITARHAPSQDV